MPHCISNNMKHFESQNRHSYSFATFSPTVPKYLDKYVLNLILGSKRDKPTFRMDTSFIVSAFHDLI